MARPCDQPGFKSLLAEWNKKLSESGFKDIEETRHGELQLKRTGTAKRYERLHPDVREARVQYFQRIQQCVASAKFENELEKQILALFAQGVSQAAIQRVLDLEGHRCRVYRPIYKWLRAWGLK